MFRFHQNYNKIKKKIALCHEKITNSRKDYLHKISHEIISENQVIVSENLQIQNMMKDHHLAKAISDVSWYELTRQLEYKAKWNGRKYIQIDTFYASIFFAALMSLSCFAPQTGHDHSLIDKSFISVFWYPQTEHNWLQKIYWRRDYDK